MNGHDRERRPTALVVGGGFAGLAAAVHLAERGHAVTLLERRPFVGGKVYSFEDPEAGHAVDNGQHAFLHGYRNSRALLARWGGDRHLAFQPRLDLNFASDVGVAPFRCAPLPAPLHLLVPLLRFRALSWRDRLGMARPALALLGLPAADRAELDAVPFGDWLGAHGQSAAAVSRFWEVLAIAALNGPVDRIGTYPALQVLSAGFLTSAEASRFGYPTRGLSALFDGFEDHLRELGGELVTRCDVRRLAARDGGGWEAQLAGGAKREADAVVVAVPPAHLARLLPEALRNHPTCTAANGLGFAPIASIHLVLDRVLPLPPVTALLDSPVHWVFRAGAIRTDAPAETLTLVLGAAQRWQGVPKEELLACALAELGRVCREAREARVVSARVVREADATLDCAPGSDRLRPGACLEGVPGLFLAGAWTRTGLPSTIEGATMSGLRAVEAVEAARGRPVTLVDPIERPGALVRATSAVLASLGPARGRAEGTTARSAP